MWVVVMFDLPVDSKLAMRRATRFRNSLLEFGFVRKQLSVYMRHCETLDHAEKQAERVGYCLPPNGQVSIMFLTDRQYTMVKNYYGPVSTVNEQAELEKMEQLCLF